MNHSEQLDAFAAALSEVQKDALIAVENAKSAQFNTKYADLESVWTACRKALTDHGFAVTQVLDTDVGQIALDTILMHKSGQWVLSHYPVTPIKPDPQSLGSAVTYARRYALAAIVGIVAGDDDGQAAVGQHSMDVNSPAMDEVLQRVTGDDVFRVGSTSYNKPQWIGFIINVAKKYSLACAYTEDLAEMKHDELQKYGLDMLTAAHDKKQGTK